MKCAKCDSTDLIPDVTIVDSYGMEGRGPLQAVVYSDPKAVLLKGAARSALQALVCGACGYTEIYALKHRQLLRAHRTSQRAGGG